MFFKVLVLLLLMVGFQMPWWVSVICVIALIGDAFMNQFADDAYDREEEERYLPPEAFTEFAPKPWPSDKTLPAAEAARLYGCVFKAYSDLTSYFRSKSLNDADQALDAMRQGLKVFQSNIEVINNPK